MRVVPASVLRGSLTNNQCDFASLHSLSHAVELFALPSSRKQHCPKWEDAHPFLRILDFCEILAPVETDIVHGPMGQA